MLLFFFFFFKQKTAYEMRISDWSSDVCSSDAGAAAGTASPGAGAAAPSSVSGTWMPAMIRARIESSPPITDGVADAAESASVRVGVAAGRVEGDGPAAGAVGRVTSAAAASLAALRIGAGGG